MERKHEYQTKSRQMILDYLIRNKDRAVHVSDAHIQLHEADHQPR